MNKLNRYLSSNGLWLPLSAFIFIVYVVQRGFASVAKSGIVPDHFPEAMQVYFWVMSVGVLAGGFLLDRFRAKDVLFFGCFLGGFGIMGIINGPWLFGIFFGAAASIVKLAPYSIQLKAFDTECDGMRIAPQAAAKNFGGAAFMLFLTAMIIGYTINQLAVALGLAMIGFGIYSYRLIPDAQITTWKLTDVLTLMKSLSFWALMAFYFVMCGIYYKAVMGLLPAMIKTGGLPKGTAMILLAISFIIAGVFRWPSAWFGKKVGYWPAVLIGTAGMAISILLSPKMPVLSTFWFAIFSALLTPNYWPLTKGMFGKEYLSTVMGLGFVAQYFGAGILCGIWE